MSENEIITIRTIECDVCDRYDSIMLSRAEIIARSNSTDMGIGAYSVVHKDHTRIIYFDKDGTYLGDTVAMNPDDVPEILKEAPKLVKGDLEPKEIEFDNFSSLVNLESNFPAKLDLVDPPKKRGKIFTFFTQRFSRNH